MPRAISPNKANGSPLLTAKSLDMTVYEKENVTLVCNALGDTPPYVAWIHNGHVIQNRTSNTQLVLQAVHVDSSGMYVCQANNQNGEVRQGIHVEVKSK